MEEVKKYGEVRPASSNLYSAQFHQHWKELSDRFNYMTRGDAVEWKVELGEVPHSDTHILLFANLWRGEKLMIPLSMEYEIKDTYDELRESWRDMFKQFMKAINAGVLSKPVAKLVATPTERQKKLEARRSVRKLAEGKGPGVHPSSDGLRKDKIGGESDSKMLREGPQSDS
jgi:hypothetical protein